MVRIVMLDPLAESCHRAIVALLVLGVAAAGVRSQTAEAARASHERMVALLAERAVAAEIDNPFYGRRAVEAARVELQRLGERAPWKLRFDAGLGELRLGNERQGIAILEAAREGLQRGVLKTDMAGMIGTSFQLGVACLRLGETENCCAVPTPDSCILPIAGAGLHGKPEGSKKAIDYFAEVLNNTDPTDHWHYAARWLLNVAHMTLGTFPDGVPAKFRLPAQAFAASGAFPRFKNIAASVGLDRVGNTGGVAIDDFDGDGRFDLVISDWSPRGQIRFYRREQDGSFADRTEAANLTGITGGSNLIHADYDNDGDLDVFVMRGGWWFEHGRLPSSLLQNRGDGTFVDVTFAAGLGERELPAQKANFADYDLDGDLDLYVGSESSPRCPCSSQLYRNNGDGTFTDVAAKAGVTNDGYAKGVAWGDYDGDRWPDLFVSNHGGKERLYHNNGDGTFTDVAAAAGVDGPHASFPGWFWDFDEDGALDLWIGNYDTTVGHLCSHLVGGALKHDVMRLYKGDGKGKFTDVARTAGLTCPAMPMGCNFGDVDNDGWLDFYLGTGDPEYASLMPNLMFRNVEGRRFEDVTMAGGFGHLQKGHGIAFADLDDDGDLDVFAVMGGAYPGDAYRCALFENPGFGNRWITVRLVGTESARCAIGARIEVTVRIGDTTRTIHRDVNAGGDFGSNPLRMTIGLGNAERIEKLAVFWPKTGRTQVVDGVALDTTITIVEGEAGFTKAGYEPLPFKPR